MDISTLRKNAFSNKKIMLNSKIIKDEGETLTYKSGNQTIICKWEERLFTTIANNVPDINFLTCWRHIHEDNFKYYVVDLFIDTKHVRVFASFFF